MYAINSGALYLVGGTGEEIVNSYPDPSDPYHKEQVQAGNGGSSREDTGIPTSVLIILVLFVVILVLAITCGVLRLCKKEEHIEGVPSYSVAISNRLFKGGG